jgi:hypothetical protein
MGDGRGADGFHDLVLFLPGYVGASTVKAAMTRRARWAPGQTPCRYSSARRPMPGSMSSAFGALTIRWCR